MEELPPEATVLPIATATVELVSHDLVADVAHVDADLVRAAGVEVALEKGVALV